MKCIQNSSYSFFCFVLNRISFILLLSLAVVKYTSKLRNRKYNKLKWADYELMNSFLKLMHKFYWSHFNLVFNWTFIVMYLDLFPLVLSVVRRSFEMNAIVCRILVDVLSALEIFVSIRWHVSLKFVDCGSKRISLYLKGIAYLHVLFAYAIHLDQLLQPILMHAMYPVGFLQWLV